ncbi:MAG: alpha/beta hydrolase, partial [Gammaproteobacteria bacterium]|nr:alpha/beta hydrolase [Gammaproteobacteria bacterium]
MSVKLLPRFLLAGALAATGLSGAITVMASPASQLTSIPGKLVDVGGFRLHIHCVGQGAPAIILDSGVGGFSLEWTRIQNALAHRTRVCSYDRAGYGWSDLGPLPRTSKRITRELHTLLQKAGVAGPYILAGHSFGGYNAQLFARNYPDETAGLVLIDASHPEQIERLPKRNPATVKQARPRSSSHVVSWFFPHPNFPDENALMAQRIMQGWQHKTTWREEMTVFSVSAKQVQTSSPMPEVPIVVLTRGRSFWPNYANGDETERIWMELQTELSELGSNPVHLIAQRSGHVIHLDQPGIVISAM